MNKFWVSLIFPFVALFCFIAQASLAEVSVIVHPTQKHEWDEEKIRGIYTGVLKRRTVELLDQSNGQEARSEFYGKFLQKTESQVKQQWSILVFSGERIPSVLADDKTVYAYIKSHPMAIGYVSSSFLRGLQPESDGPVEIFSIK